jgi:hypothetical protein
MSITSKKTIMKQLLLILKSRTIWTLVFMFVFNGFAAISGQLDPQVVTLINVLLTTLAGYFKLNPSATY